MQVHKTQRQRGFGHGGLRLVVLHLLSQQPRHGYELIKTIATLTNNLYRPSPGVLYPLLTELEQQQLIEQCLTEGDRRKQCYQLTAAGQQRHQEEQAHIQQILQHVSRWSKYPKRVVQAIEDFRYELHESLSQQSLNEEQTEKFVQILKHTLEQVKQL
ncbi:PadR family transcriptional regulator [Acinetobacter rudis]|uniref:PadR family transcriptional regulator n=1 Tax=Acinetobacter rudis TaxID=632955 RepID=A0AAW8J7V5_9GAMM|nr:PadR family transcriptional regulator [Acinetobacter rudis]MDQ8936226.1 PadR family transcriptional regulator [Acinetobacter rudis]MDQ9018489.1 PadR family transcriptional regulator [Acinetobacter rudis]